MGNVFNNSSLSNPYQLYHVSDISVNILDILSFLETKFIISSYHPVMVTLRKVKTFLRGGALEEVFPQQEGLREFDSPHLHLDFLLTLEYTYCIAEGGF